MQPQIKKGKPRIKEGVIIKKSGQNTVKVAVTRLVRHPIYKKQYKVTRYFLVDDRSNQSQIGQKVQIIETKPISKRKHFKILSV